MKNFEIKNITGGVKDVDSASRRVKVAISQVNSKDFDEDVIDSVAYNKTIIERGPKGTNLIWHLTDHWASLKNAIGKPSEIFMEGDYLVFVTDIPKTTLGNDMLVFYQDGHINQHSIGFRTVKDEIVNAGKPEEYRLIKEILLYEGSAVLWGANPNTPTLSVGKSITKEERETEFKKTMDDLGSLHKMFKSGHLSDQSYELIELKISQLTEKLQQLFAETTQPAEKAVEPENKEVLDVIKTFNKTLNTDDNDRARKERAARAA